MGWNDTPASAEEAWKTSSIILVSLPLGVTLFAAVVLLVVRPEPAPDSFWLPFWIGYTLLALIGTVVLWRRTVRPHLPSSRRGTREPAPYGQIQTGLIICMAIVEGTALFGVVTVLLGADRAVAVASVALVWIAWFVMRPRREWFGLR